jgi:hypothetical protein
VIVTVSKVRGSVGIHAVPGGEEGAVINRTRSICTSLQTSTGNSKWLSTARGRYLVLDKLGVAAKPNV